VRRAAVAAAPRRRTWCKLDGVDDPNGCEIVFG
jgi:hypothetical protein